jgi:hypothetical protein
VDDKDFVPRSVNSSDFLVVIVEFFHNLAQTFHTLTESLLELSIYNANRKVKVNRTWEQFTTDLEKMEDNNG